MYGTEEADDAVRVTEETQVDDLRDFAKMRALNPRKLEVDDRVITIWNFSTHVIDEAALVEVTQTLQKDRYVIPYQLPGVWGYFQNILPVAIRNAELLVYSQKDGRYKAFPNFGRLSDEMADSAVRMEIREELEQSDGDKA